MHDIKRIQKLPKCGGQYTEIPNQNGTSNRQVICTMTIIRVYMFNELAVIRSAVNVARLNKRC